MGNHTRPVYVQLPLPEYLAIKEIAAKNNISMRVAIQTAIAMYYKSTADKYRNELDSKPAGDFEVDKLYNSIKG